MNRHKKNLSAAKRHACKIADSLDAAQRTVLCDAQRWGLIGGDVAAELASKGALELTGTNSPLDGPWYDITYLGVLVVDALYGEFRSVA